MTSIIQSVQFSIRVSCISYTTTAAIYTLSLHDALPIWSARSRPRSCGRAIAHSAAEPNSRRRKTTPGGPSCGKRSEEHTSELQSRGHLVCRLLLEKKKTALGIINTQSRTKYLAIVIHVE